MRLLAIAVLSFAVIPVSIAETAADSVPTSLMEKHMQIRLTVNDKTITAKVIESPTARDFISLLPLTLTMNDLFKREKFGHLPRTISTDSKHAHTYALGDIAYWSPGPDIAIYYHYDGERIPDPGVVVIAKIGAGLDVLDVSGAVKVTMELVK
jgi:hypothetical protein